MTNQTSINSDSAEALNSFKVKIIYATLKEETIIDITTEFPMEALAEDITSHLKSGVFGYLQDTKMILIPTNQILRIEICNVDYIETIDETEIENCKITAIKFLTNSVGAKRLTPKLGFKSSVIKVAAQQLVEENKIKPVSWGKYSLIISYSSEDRGTKNI